MISKSYSNYDRYSFYLKRINPYQQNINHTYLKAATKAVWSVISKVISY